MSPFPFDNAKLGLKVLEEIYQSRNKEDQTSRLTDTSAGKAALVARRNPSMNW
jgi:hypothetical protein